MWVVMRWFGLVLAALVSACSQTNPVVTTLGAVWHDPTAVVQFKLGYEYLKVQTQGRQSMLVLSLRQVQGRDIDELWYSTDREMLHLHNGRLVEAVGLTREIRRTSEGAPSWDSLNTKAQVWVHERDLMPYYQYGVRQFVISQQVTPTPQEQALVPRAQRWIQEQVKTESAKEGTWVHDEIFALDGKDRVLYSEQCIAADLCLQMTYLGRVLSP
jgi:Group 4 capsule polysaccharide lipoprotein gfcB, YjbF